MDKNFLQEILKKLKVKGCDQADVFFVESLTMSSSRRMKKLEKNEQSESKEIGIRAILGKRQSIISSNDLSSKNIDLLIERLFDMVSIVPENQFCGLTETENINNFNQEQYSKLDLFDKKLPTINELTECARKLENSALENNLIINSEGAEVSWTKTNYKLIASNGMFQEFKKTNSSYILAVLAGNSSSMEREYDFKSTVYFDEMGDLEKIGSQTAKRAVKKLNSKKIKTCKGNVLFSSKIASSLLRNLFSATNSSTVSRGTSFLKDKLNKKLFNDNINIIDDPLMPKKIQSKILDCEGTRTKKSYLIENGILKFFFNTLEYAKQLKHHPTGHASRGVSSLPYASPSNLFLNNGNIPLNSMIRNIKKGMLVTELMGSSINMSTGDYSRGASGFWIENGEILYPISEVTIAGNLLDIFANLIPANDLNFDYSINAPSCLVENMTIAGI